MVSLADTDWLHREFRSTVEVASFELGLSPIRPIPEIIELEDFPVGKGYRAGALNRGRSLILSSRLDEKKLSVVLKREAFNLFIPGNLDDLGLIYDLSWAYSGAEVSWWRECTEVVWDPRFPLYNAPETLSPLPRRALLNVLRRILQLVRNLNNVGRHLSREEYLSIFSEMVGLLEPIKLSKVQRKVIQELARSPYLNQKELARRIGFTRSAVSKSLSKLASLGILSGPENVILERIGLAGLLAVIPDLPGMERAFARFPFTYRILRPISRGLPSFVMLIFPSEGLTHLRRALDGEKVRLARMVRLTFSYKGAPFNPDADVGRAVKLLSEGVEFKIRGKREPEIPKLSRYDLMIVNQVLRRGRVSVSTVRAMGIPSAESRLRRLRELGIIRRLYAIGGFRLGRPISALIKSEQRDFPKISAALGAISTSLSYYVEGDINGTWGILLTSERDVLKVMQSLKIVFGSELAGAIPLLDFSPSYWSIPVELWDEGRNRFRYEQALEQLLSSLSPSDS